MENNKIGIYESMEKEIRESELSDGKKQEALAKLSEAKGKTVNLMLVGSTGAGKSSTINALFDMEKAKVGIGVDPETNDIASYQLENLTIWDTPGLGDSVERDRATMELIRKKLCERDGDGNALIDLVLVIIDASQKDLGTVYDCINKVLVPVLGGEASRRILIGLNQADVAMKGNHWISELNIPDDTLRSFLDEKSAAVEKRIRESTGISFRPVYYCAGYTEPDGEQRRPYNLSKLLYSITSSVPGEKRLVLADVLNSDSGNWEYSDGEIDYQGCVRKDFWDSVGDCLGEFADAGFNIGSTILGVPGGIIGGVIGGAVGFIAGAISSLFS